LIIEANLGNAMDVAQGFGELEIGVAGQAPFERRDDFAARQAITAWPPHGQDEGQPNLAL
jgi:hypothetical protein